MSHFLKFRLAFVAAAFILAFFYIGFFFIGRVQTLIVINSLLVGMFVATTISLRREAFAALRRGIADGSDAFIAGSWGKSVFFSLYFLYVVYYNSLSIPGVDSPSPAQLELRASPISGTLISLILIAQSYILFAPTGVPRDIGDRSMIILGVTVAAAIGGVVAGILMTLGYVGMLKI